MNLQEYAPCRKAKEANEIMERDLGEVRGLSLVVDCILQVRSSQAGTVLLHYTHSACYWA